MLYVRLTINYSLFHSAVTQQMEDEQQNEINAKLNITKTACSARK